MIPDALWPPGPVPVPPRGTEPPFIIEQAQRPGEGVLVTFSLPGLKRLSVTVPEASWLAGEHLPIGTMAAQLFASMLPTQFTPNADVADSEGDAADD